MMASSPLSISGHHASILRRAKPSALSSWPIWWTSAPQHPSPGAGTMPTPSRLSRRRVAALISGSRTDCAHPPKIATCRSKVCFGASCGRAAGQAACRHELQHRLKPLSAGQTCHQRRKRAPQSSQHQCRAEPARIGQDRRQDPPQCPVMPGARIGLFDVRAGVIDKVHIVHARRARRHARKARQAPVHMLDHLGIGRFAVLQHVLDHVDAAPRGIPFIALQQISGAGGRTEPAMDARAQDFFRFPHVTVGELFLGKIGLHQYCPARTPGLNMPMGSSAAFTRPANVRSAAEAGGA